jgi:hypothetical protein
MLNVALEEKFKIYEKTYGKKLEDVNSMRSLYAKQLSRRTKRTIAFMLNK